MSDKKKKVSEAALKRLLDKKARLESQQAAVDEQIAEAKKSIAEEARNAETHAKILIGGMVLSHFDCAWNAVDFEKLSKYLAKFADAYKTCTCEPLELTPAKARLRNWEVKHQPWDSWPPPAQQGSEPEQDQTQPRKEEEVNSAQPALTSPSWKFDETWA